MFTPQLTNKSKLSSSFVDRTVTGDRRTSALFMTESKPRTPLTGRAALVTSFLEDRSVAEAGEHILVDFGLPIPVVATETIAVAKNASAKLSRNGWAWMVSGNKLVIWNFKPLPFVKAGQSFELNVPVSHVVNTASLIVVYSTKQAAAPGCIAVSPDGILRQWTNVTLSNHYTDVTLFDHHHDHCTEIVVMQSGDCLVGTSSGVVYVITSSLNQAQLVCRTLKSAEGMISGLTRRVTSLFYTPSSTQSPVPIRRLLVGEMIAANCQALYILTANQLQKWALRPDSDKLVYECNLLELLSDRIATMLWSEPADQLANMKSWLLDIQLTSEGVLLLGAGVNCDVSSDVRYVIGSLYTMGDDAPSDFSSFDSVEYVTALEEADSWVPSFRMILPSTSASFVYLYDSMYILCVSRTHPHMPPETVEFLNLGCGCCDDEPLFISNYGDLVAVREVADNDMNISYLPTNKTAASFQNLDTSIAANVSREKIDELSASSNKLSKLKAAFLSSIQDSAYQSRAQTIVDTLFPPGVPVSSDTGSQLDTLVAELSREMIDDYPASDPRWAESLPSGVMSSSVSLILMHQLDDKFKAHELYLRFLKSVNVWSRLTTVRVDGVAMSTNMLLCEHAEKIEAIKVLRDFHLEHTDIVDTAISQVVEHRHSGTESRLSHTDVFYREVSRFQDIFSHLASYVEKHLSMEIASNEVYRIVSAVNAILIGVVSAAVRYRCSASSVYQVISSDSSSLTEFVPWTASLLIRSALRKQFDSTLEHCLPVSTTAQEKGLLYQQLLQLSDVYLDGYRIQLDSIKKSCQKQATVGGRETDRYIELFRKYEQERATLIEPFMRFGEYEKAASLAEKYCDFAALVELCELLNNQERLRRYMDHFHQKSSLCIEVCANGISSSRRHLVRRGEKMWNNGHGLLRIMGFSDFVFKWFMDKGKRGKLIASDLSSHPLLAKFLDTKENQFMSWLHDIHNNDFYQAHKTLMALAVEEQDSAAKKKTLLSLSKLAALACEDKPDDVHTNIDAIDLEQDLITHQEQLPTELIEMFGMNTSAMPVMTAKKLIEILTSDFNPFANEFDFKKALDLLHYIPLQGDPSRGNILLEIWCRALLKDRWQNITPLDPGASCRETVFYKTLEIVVATTSSEDVGKLLPSADRLFECDLLGDLRHDADFKYLVSAALEHIHRTAASVCL